jgi:hypothetical protein
MLILYFLTDHPLFFAGVGLREYDKAWLKRLDYWNNVFWMANSLLDIAVTVVDLQQLQTEIKDKVRLLSPVDRPKPASHLFRGAIDCARLAERAQVYLREGQSQCAAQYLGRACDPVLYGARVHAEAGRSPRHNHERHLAIWNVGLEVN